MKILTTDNLKKILEKIENSDVDVKRFINDQKFLKKININVSDDTTYQREGTKPSIQVNGTGTNTADIVASDGNGIATINLSLLDTVGKTNRKSDDTANWSKTGRQCNIGYNFVYNNGTLTVYME